MDHSPHHWLLILFVTQYQWPTCWSSQSLDTAQGHSCTPGDIYVRFLSSRWPISGVFPSYFYSPLCEHVALILYFLLHFLAWLSPALIALLVRRRGEKERWECQRGSTRQLRVINHCHDGERRWMKDVRAGARQTWQESLSPEMGWIGPFSAPGFVVDTRLWHHILLSEAGSWTRHALTDKSIWIVHWITASPAAPRVPERLAETAELWIMKIFRVHWGRRAYYQTQRWHVYCPSKPKRSGYMFGPNWVTTRFWLLDVFP